MHVCFNFFVKNKKYNGSLLAPKLILYIEGKFAFHRVRLIAY